MRPLVVAAQKAHAAAVAAAGADLTGLDASVAQVCCGCCSLLVLNEACLTATVTAPRAGSACCLWPPYVVEPLPFWCGS